MTITNKQDIFAQVQAVVAEQLGVDQQEVTMEKSFVSDLGADSLDTVELVMALEDKFDVSIEDSDAESITTVQRAVDYVAKVLNVAE